jgi:hypothetical protein
MVAPPPVKRCAFQERRRRWLNIKRLYRSESQLDDARESLSLPSARAADDARTKEAVARVLRIVASNYQDFGDYTLVSC